MKVNLDGSDNREVLRGKGDVPSLAINYEKKRICWVRYGKSLGIHVIDIAYIILHIYLLLRDEKKTGKSVNGLFV